MTEWEPDYTGIESGKSIVFRTYLNLHVGEIGWSDIICEGLNINHPTSDTIKKLGFKIGRYLHCRIPDTPTRIEFHNGSLKTFDELLDDELLEVLKMMSSLLRDIPPPKDYPLIPPAPMPLNDQCLFLSEKETQRMIEDNYNRFLQGGSDDLR